MNTFIRRAGRSGAALAGTLVLGLSLAACGGGGDEAESDAAPPEEAAEEEAPSDEGGTEEDAAAEEGPSDEGGAEDDAAEGDDSEGGSAEDVTDEDLEAAKSTALDFFNALGDDDLETVCEMAFSPVNDVPASEGGIDECVKQFEEMGVSDVYTPEVMELINEDTLEAEAQDDGNISIMVEGQSSPMEMQKADDGEWYVKLV